jgi:exonuclease SbcD
VSSLEPFRFLLTGDLHLDSPVEGLSSEAPPEVLALLRGATTAAWRGVVDAAMENGVDFVVIAGDVFEVASPTLLGQTRFRDGLARLADAGISSYVVHGNHDPLDGRSWAPSLTFPAAVHRFGTDAGESAPVLRDGREIARIHGRSYPRASVTENYAAGMRADAASPFSIGLFDAGRAAAAAEAVQDLATRHQVIYFTCHAETAGMLDPGGGRTVALA